MKLIYKTLMILYMYDTCKKVRVKLYVHAYMCKSMC